MDLWPTHTGRAEPLCGAEPPIWPLKLLQDYKKTALVTISTVRQKGRLHETSGLTFRGRRGHSSGRTVARTGTPRWLRLNCSRGFVQKRGPECHPSMLCIVTLCSVPCALGSPVLWSLAPLCAATAQAGSQPQRGQGRSRCCCLPGCWGVCPLEYRRDSDAWTTTSWCHRVCRVCKCRFQYGVIPKENSWNRCSRSHMCKDWQRAWGAIESSVNKASRLVWCVG